MNGIGKFRRNFNRSYLLVNNVVVRDDNSRDSDVRGDRADGDTMSAVACVTGKDNVRTLVDGEAVILVPDRTVLDCLWGK